MPPSVQGPCGGVPAAHTHPNRSRPCAPYNGAVSRTRVRIGVTDALRAAVGPVPGKEQCMKPSNSRRPPIRRRTSRGTDLWRTLVDPDQDLSARRRVLGDLLLAYPGRLTIIYFIMLVVIATVLLTLPVSSRSPGSTDPLTAFYTAVSALSTCGIPIVNSTEHWSVFGQCVILVSVQLGGLGVMTFASLIMLATARHLRASQRLRTANELGASALGETRDVLAVVFATTFIIEGITFAALFPGLFSINRGDWGQTAWEALFYAVSAYNNTGFTPDAAGLHVNSPAVGLPILLSAFCGTLGFPVLLNLARACRRRIPPRRWQLHTKLTLVTTFALVLCSLLWYVAVEWNNPRLYADADLGVKLQAALSAAVMPRSAGFDLSWVPELSDPTRVFMSMLMFIGGGSSSTAGGIRVTTLAVLVLTCRAALTGHGDVTAFRRRLPMRVVMMAVSVTLIFALLTFAASLALMFVTDKPLSDVLFEACSALSLGGYSVGVANAQEPATLVILALLMIAGRIGPTSVVYAISRPHATEALRYPEESIIVG
ncbi:cation transporter [Bifidobacterium pullorum]|uniref:Cation transporter n=1 Tax=Bifidobacterium pullorum TaxID=78448 RepID=A0A7V8HR65_9BIFI|nr:cation transporter [Bifidobacterium pullorum]